jgi:hypothetical protein
MEDGPASCSGANVKLDNVLGQSQAEKTRTTKMQLQVLTEGWPWSKATH